MGRTKRTRARKKSRSQCPPTLLDTERNTIELKQWMHHKSWQNHSNLQLRDFALTGRGVSSTKKVNTNDCIIEIPYNLMITQTVLERSDLKDFINQKLTIHELLAIFLVVEKQKGGSSDWSKYIQSLPGDIPQLPWLCSELQIISLPFEFQQELQKHKHRFDCSWENIQKAVDFTWKSFYCAEGLDCVITANSFAWGYIMVNTRAVYVDPDIVSRLSDNTLGRILSDDPSMALCPYLDMFNHSYTANTQAELRCDKNCATYHLTTLTPYEKYEQIFISYGAHDNLKLLCEYGFYIPSNKFDCERLDFAQMPEWMRQTGHGFDERQYKFIREKFLNEKLYLSPTGLSFNLKAVLYVAMHPEIRNWNACVYSENYSVDDSRKMLLLARHILKDKIQYSGYFRVRVDMKNIIDYLKYVETYRAGLLDYIAAELKALSQIK